MVKKAVLPAVLLAVTMGANAQDSGPFTISELSAEHNISALKAVNFFAPGKPALVASGRSDDERKFFSFFEMNGKNQLAPNPKLKIEMPEDAVFYDFATVFDADQQSLLFLNSDGVHIFDIEKGEARQIASLSSIYKQNGSPLFSQIDFVRDLNGDGFADILVPDFEGYRLLINDGHGGFSGETLLKMDVEMRLRGNIPRYSQFPVYAFDANFDGRTDIVFHKDNSFLAFLQGEDGSFAAEATIYSFDIDVVGNSFGAQVASNERYSDQTDLAETIVSTIEDINGDGIMDIVTQTDRARGLFNRSTEYGFHYGAELNGRIAYETEPTAALTLKGITANTRHIDFAKDGRMDFAGGAVNIGIGKIIGILLSGSVGIPVMFYEQNEDGQFSEDPSYRKKISVDFDMSSGQSSVPVVEMTDYDGDGHKDLVLSKDNKGLRVYHATPSAKKMFARKAIEIDLSLPKNGEQVTAADLNGDGKGDLMMYFDRLGADGETNRNKVVVLIAN